MNLPQDARREAISALTEAEADALAHDWSEFGRPEQQLPPGDWRQWLIMAGRGWGKSRTGAEAVRSVVEMGMAERIALIGATAADTRDVMVEGESGLLNVFPAASRPLYQPSRRRVVFDTGAVAMMYSAEEPDRLRGPQHDFAWEDEIAAWKRPETHDMLLMGLRLGNNPRLVATTTPRPLKIVRDLLASPTTYVTRGSTYDNALNLAPQFMQQIIARYEGTRLGRQELAGELLDDIPGALWKRAMFDARHEPPGLTRIVVAVDPAVTSGEDSDETGIIVAAKGTDARYYVLDDRSCRLSPDGWARQAVQAYDDWAADRIIAEVNQGGDMVKQTIRTVRPGVPFTPVHATRGKAIRAEPISALYEQGRVTHVRAFDHLEDQLCTWEPHSGTSPDRLDALVWALTALSERAADRGATAI